jgi:hypothetical protein
MGLDLALALIIAISLMAAYGVPPDSGASASPPLRYQADLVAFSVGVWLSAIALVRERRYPMLLVASAGAADGLAAFVVQARHPGRDRGRAARRRFLGDAGGGRGDRLPGQRIDCAAELRGDRCRPNGACNANRHPVVLAPLVGGEGWSGTPLGGLVLGVALVTIAVGAGLLASSPGVAQLAATHNWMRFFARWPLMSLGEAAACDPGRHQRIPTHRDDCLTPLSGVLSGIARGYELVVIDSSPVLPVGDRLELVPQVDGMLLCVRLDRRRTSRLGHHRYPGASAKTPDGTRRHRLAERERGRLLRLLLVLERRGVRSLN